MSSGMDVDMSRRISIDVQQRVLDVRKQGMSYRQIAALVGISRGAVEIIVHRGAVKDWHKRVANRAEEYDGSPAEVAPYYCPGCEYTVCLRPCLICLARKRRIDDG